MTKEIDEKAAKAEANKARSEAMEKRETELNAGKTGKGLRTFLALTRGKGAKEIQFDGFDKTQPDTLPKTVDEFTSIVGAMSDEKAVSLLIDGFNEQAYTSASDPIAEFVDLAWDDDTIVRFKQMIRNYVKDTDATVEEAVELMKPGISAKFEKDKAKAAAAPKA